MATQFGTLGTIETLTIGTRVYIDLTNLKRLYAQIGNANRKATFRSQDATSGYQVTAGKTLLLDSAEVWSASTAGAAIAFLFFYADNDIGFDSSATPTNAVYLMNSFNTFYVGLQNAKISTINMYFKTIATKYPGADCGVISGNAGNVLAYGYES